VLLSLEDAYEKDTTRAFCEILNLNQW